MASRSITATPISSPAPQLPAAPTPPGSWRHPRLAEINQRKEAASFDSSKLKVFVFSVVFLLLSFLIPSYLPSGGFIPMNSVAQQIAKWLLRIFRLVVACNGYFAIKPILPFGRKDDFSDIPLTPRQRELMGLPPSSTPPTPGSTYITPPRFVRSTPRASSAASSRAATVGSSPLNYSVSGSPLSGSPLRQGPFGSGGSFAGSPASGLVRRATVAGSKRWSLGAGNSPLAGLEESVFGPASPSPASGSRGVSVALNNKWLYKRKHGSPGGSTSYI